MKNVIYKFSFLIVTALVLGVSFAYAAPGDSSKIPLNPGNMPQPVKQIHIGGSNLTSSFDASGTSGSVALLDKGGSLLTIIGNLFVHGSTWLGNGNLNPVDLSIPWVRGSFPLIQLPQNTLNIAGTFLSSTFTHDASVPLEPLCVKSGVLSLCTDISGIATTIYSCTGTTPTNATLCASDDTGLTADTAKTSVSTCGTPKCEYSCNSGYMLSAGVCVPITYSCTGTTPTNATLCTDDNLSLTVDTAKTLVTSCGTPKCEYTCNSGYTLSAGVCVPITYSCTGTTPTNSTLCSGDDTGLTADTAKTLVATCTTATKCEYAQNPETVSFVSTAETLTTSDTYVNTGTNPLTGASIYGQMCTTGSMLTNSVYLPLGKSALAGNFVYQQLYKDAARTQLYSNTGYIRFYSGSSSNVIFKVTSGKPTSTTVPCP